MAKTADAESSQVRKEEKSHKIICVLGMHRSGTSVITRGLFTLGADLGKDLLEAATDNTKGFFEDSRIVRLNEEILLKLGSSWRSLDEIHSQRLTGVDFYEERANAFSILKQKTSESSLVAIKDPRLSILMPFWECIFEDLGVDVHYVIALRNPLATARSLFERDKIALEKGAALWGKYTLSALQHSLTKSHTLIDFDMFAEEPLRQLDLIATNAGLDNPIQESAAVQSFLGDFLETRLINQSVGLRELRRSGRVHTIVADIYENLLANIKGRNPSESSETAPIKLAELQSKFEELSPLFRLIDSLERDAIEANRVVAQKAQSIEQLDALAKSWETKFLDSENEKAEIERQLNETNNQTSKTVDELNQIIVRTQSAHDIACEDRERARKELEATQAANESLNSNYIIAADERNKAQVQLSQTERELENSQTKIRDLITEQDRSIAQLQNTNAELEDARAELSSTTQAREQALSDLVIANDTIKTISENAENDIAALELKMMEEAKTAEDLYGDLSESYERLQSEHHEVNELLSAELDSHQEIIEEQSNRIERLESALDQSDSEISSLEGAYDRVACELEKVTKEIARVKSKNASLSDIIERQINHIEKNERDLHKTQNELTHTKDRLEKSQELNTQSESELLALNASIDPLKAMVQREAETAKFFKDQLSNAKSEIQDFKSSSSWRITAPARAFARSMRTKHELHPSPRTRYATLSSALWKSAVGAKDSARQNFPPASPIQMVAQSDRTTADASQAIAVVVHAFYIDIFKELIDLTSTVSSPIILHVTTPVSQSLEVKRILMDSEIDFRLYIVDNRGRDLAPFIELLPVLEKSGVDLFLKVHTKTSPHLGNGNLWRERLYASLLHGDRMERAVSAFQNDASLGILAPEGHILKLQEFVGSNEKVLKRLTDRLHIDDEAVRKAEFVAGTMFYGRLSIFRPLLDAELSTTDFEPERGQLDGTLAHGIERISGVLAEFAGKRIAPINDPDDRAGALHSREYPFL